MSGLRWTLTQLLLQVPYYSPYSLTKSYARFLASKSKLNYLMERSNALASIFTVMSLFWWVSWSMWQLILHLNVEFTAQRIQKEEFGMCSLAFTQSNKCCQTWRTSIFIFFISFEGSASRHAWSRFLVVFVFWGDRLAVVWLWFRIEQPVCSNELSHARDGLYHTHYLIVHRAMAPTGWDDLLWYLTPHIWKLCADAAWWRTRVFHGNLLTLCFRSFLRLYA